MNQEDVDKIIAEAVAESKNKSRKKWHKGKSSTHNVETIRRVLNWVFMIGFVAAIVIYFALAINSICVVQILFDLRA